MGNQSPAAGIVPPFVGYNSPGNIKFDPDKAKRLLKDAGYPNGEGFPKINFLTTDRESSKRLAEALQAMEKNILASRLAFSKWNGHPI